MKSIYPGMGNVTHDLHCLIVPRNMQFDNILHIMWNSVSSSAGSSSWWQPNHFIHLLTADLQTITPAMTKKAERNRTKKMKNGTTEREQTDGELEEEQGATEGEWMDGEPEEEQGVTERGRAGERKDGELQSAGRAGCNRGRVD